MSANTVVDFSGTASARTPVGTNVTVQVGDVLLTFANVTAEGTTSSREIDPTTAGPPPSGYALFDPSRDSGNHERGIDITTTATFSGSITLAGTVDHADDPAVFARLRILHGENGVLVDRTILPPDSPVPDFNTRTIYARVSSLSPFVLALVQTQSISGHVVDSAGNSLSNVSVTLSGSQTGTTTTDANGNYTFGSLPVGGNYTVSASKANYTFTPPSQTFNNLDRNQTANFTATLQTFTISGRVTSDGTNGLSSVTVTLSGGASATATTDNNGNYSFTVNAGGNYSVTPSKANYSFTPPNQAFNSLGANQTANFTATPTPTYTISGRVLDDAGNGLGGVSLTISGGANLLNPVTTGNDGTFSFQKVTGGGSYTITPSKQNYTFAPATQSFDSLSANQTANFTATLRITVQTPTGTNVPAQAGPSSFTFTSVTQAGMTTLTTINPASAGTPPSGYAAIAAPAFDLSTTAQVSGAITTCFQVPFITDATQFASLRVLHGEGGTLVDRTSSSDFASRTICSTQSSLSPFVIAQFTAPPPPPTFSLTGRIVDASNNSNGLANIVVTLSGANSSTTLTDANGNYGFTNLVGNSGYTITPSSSLYSFKPSNQTFNNLSSNQQNVNFSGTQLPTPQPPPPPSTNFDGPLNPAVFLPGTLTSTNFNPNVVVAVANGKLQITPQNGASGDNGIVTANPVDLTITPSVSIEVDQTATGEGAETIFALGNDSDNFYRFVVTSSDSLPSGSTSASAKGSSQVKDNSSSGTQTLSFQTNLNGQKFAIGIPYNPVEQRFWRLRHDAIEQTINFETSPDARVWHLRYKSAISKSVKALTAELSAGTTKPVSNPGTAIFDNLGVVSPVSVQFMEPAYTVAENGGSVQITVSRAGTAESAAAISYATINGSAIAGIDYTATAGTLTFGVGETNKSFSIPIIDNRVAGADKTLSVNLANPIGTGLGTPSSVVLTILNGGNRTTNAIDDTRFFVRQQYLDFLGREPDADGLEYWSQRIISCGSDQKCISARRIDVSAAFFLSREFQDTGSFVYRLYKASYGVRPTYSQFKIDRSRVVGGDNLDAAKQEFVVEWVDREEFHALYDKLTNAQYVDALYANAGVRPSSEERTALIAGLLSKRETRASVLQQVVANEDLIRKEFNPSFVLAEYFEYLRRDPDEAGYQFWLGILNNKVPGNYRAMVCAFITSAEYQFRFGSVRTRTDAQCAQ